MTGLIEDRELRDMFRAESLEHAQKIEAGLLELERQPEQAPLLEEVFREAHSLKGAARMLGLRDIQNLAHAIETLLGEARQGKAGITAATVAAQLTKLDQIRHLVALAVGDAVEPEPGAVADDGTHDPAACGGASESAASPTQTDSLNQTQTESPAPFEFQPDREGPSNLPGLSAASRSEVPVSPATRPVNGATSPAPATHPASHPGQGSESTPAPLDAIPVTPSQNTSSSQNGAGIPAAPGPGEGAVVDFHIETLRIESSRLDALLQLGGELVVSKGRIGRWHHELDRLQGQCDYLQKHPAEGVQGLAELSAEIARLRGQLTSDIARLETVATQLEASIRKLRLLPMATLLDLFPRMVRDLAVELGKQVSYRVEGASTVADKRILEELKAPLTHLLRNCIDHGIESPVERRRAGKPEEGQIRIRVTSGADAVHLLISDDGRGLDLEAIRRQAIKQRLHTADELRHLTEAQVQALILRPGFSTSPMITDISGRGVGLDVVRAGVERLRGALTLESVAGQGLTIRLRLPVSLTATRAMLVREWGQTYALPFDDIAFLRRLRPADLHVLEGRQGFYEGDQAIPLERLGLLLERPPPAFKEEERVQCVALRVGGETFALALDEVLDAEDIVVKPTTAPLIRVRNLAGLAVLNSGLVCPVLNGYDLLRGMNRKGQIAVPVAAEEQAQERKRILLAEDSITTRMQERRILEAAGYAVETAVDGLDAWNKLALHPFDAVVSDIQMPRMSGLELAERIRKNRKFAEVPIVLITSLATEEDRRRGLAAGADAYITKSEFDQTLLLDCLSRLA